MNNLSSLLGGWLGLVMEEETGGLVGHKWPKSHVSYFEFCYVVKMGSLKSFKWEATWSSSFLSVRKGCFNTNTGDSDIPKWGDGTQICTEKKKWMREIFTKWNTKHDLVTNGLEWEIRKRESRMTPEFVTRVNVWIVVPITNIRYTRRRTGWGLL